MDEKTETVVDLRKSRVIIDIDTLGSHDSVLTALAQRYERDGHRVQQMWVGDCNDGQTTGMFDLAVPDEKLLVDVETSETLIGLDPHRYDDWRAAGYEVWVVAPEESVEQVSRRLRHNFDHIQGWKIDGPQVIFDQPR